MASPVVQVRLGADEVAWLDEIAAEQGLTRSGVVKMALAAFDPPRKPNSSPPRRLPSEPNPKLAAPVVRRRYPRTPDDCTHPINYRDSSNRCNACGDQR